MKTIVRVCFGLLVCLALAACGRVVTKGSAPTLDSAKHCLYLRDYTVYPGGVVKIPDACRWHALATTAPNWSGHVLLVLEEARTETAGVRSVVSYLTPLEALHLSDQLHRAARECAELAEATKKESDEREGIGPTVKAEVPTLYLENVTERELLDAMLGAMGLDYDVRPGFVWISTPDVLAEEPSIPPEVLAELPPLEDKTPEQLMQDVERRLNARLNVDFTAGTDIRKVLDFLSHYSKARLVLDDRVMLPSDPMYGVPPKPKHEFYLNDYEILPEGIVRLPDACDWLAFPTVESCWKGHPLLVLDETRTQTTGFWPVMSYLTPEEASELSEQLREAATQRAEELSSQ